MQEIQYNDGSFSRKFFEADSEEALKAQMKAEYEKAMKDDVESIRQTILDPNSRCPCGSGKLTKNCCIKRLQRYVKKQEYFEAH